MAKRAIIVPVITLGSAALLLFTIQGCWTSWEGGRREQRTDDAYVRADMTPLSTRISGTVRKVDVNDYQAVKAGQLLVELNDDDYQAALAEADAALAAAQAELESNQEAKRVQDAKIQSAKKSVSQAEAAVEAAKAGIVAARADWNRAASERRRQEALLASRSATRQQVEVAVAAAESSAGLLASRQADLDRAQAALAGSRSLLEAEKQQRLALNVRDAGYRANIQAREAAIVVAKVNLGYTRIDAPVAGTIGERHVLEGQLVTPGKQLLDLVEGDVWIQANYKETQLTNIRKGDIADVKIDTFPGSVLHGKVEEISPASGSQFALLPPDNATGNFTKVTQRVPVKISLDKDSPLLAQLRPGLSAIVTIHAGDKHVKGAGGE